MTSTPLYEELAGDSPLLISFPHSGTHVPPDLLARLNSEVRDLPDTDWFVPELYKAHHELGASLIRDVRYAVTAPAGMRYVVTGIENVRPNPPGPV